MIPFLDSAAAYLVSQSWQITTVFLLVAVACWGLRKKNAHWHYLLWLVVLVKCLTPAPIDVPLAILPSPVAMTNLPETRPQLTDIGPYGDVPVAATAVESERAIDDNRTIAALSATRQHKAISDADAAASFSITDLAWRQWLAVTWLAGIVLFLSLVSIRAWATHRTLRKTRRPVDSKTASTVAEVAQKLGIRAIPTVHIVDGTAQPFVWGWFRGSIYLPQSFGDNGTAQQRHAILGPRTGTYSPLGCGSQSLADSRARRFLLSSTGMDGKPANSSGTGKML